MFTLTDFTAGFNQTLFCKICCMTHSHFVLFAKYYDNNKIKHKYSTQIGGTHCKQYCGRKRQLPNAQAQAQVGGSLMKSLRICSYMGHGQ
jgi:hypothetical protein